LCGPRLAGVEQQQDVGALPHVLLSRAAVVIETLPAYAVAMLARWLFGPFLGDHLPFIIFIVAVASWIGGWRAGLLATIPTDRP
jgi:hypothetical protein